MAALTAGWNDGLPKDEKEVVGLLVVLNPKPDDELAAGAELPNVPKLLVGAAAAGAVVVLAPNPPKDGKDEDEEAVDVAPKGAF